jgi:hypothetical protein
MMRVGDEIDGEGRNRDWRRWERGMLERILGLSGRRKGRRI